FSRDWSSDVCSSDLPAVIGSASQLQPPATAFAWGRTVDGMTLGVATERNEYRLNNRINLWVSMRTADGLPVDRALASDSDVFIKIGRASCRERGEAW